MMTVPFFPRQRGSYVYALADPRSGKTRYVGKVSDGYLRRRLGAHIREASSGGRTHKCAWVRQLLLQSLEPVLTVIECVDPQAASDRERFWIAELRSEGARLTNSTDGGEGMPNPTEETRIRLSQRVQPPMSAETRLLRSESARRMWQDPVYLANRVHLASKKAPPMSGEELREFRVLNAKRMGALNKGVPKSIEHRQKLAVASSGKKQSDETKAKRIATRSRHEGGGVQ